MMNQGEWSLSRAEIRYVMKLLGADAMIGLGTVKRVAMQTLNRGRASLTRRGLVTAGPAESQERIDPALESLALASFFPDGALVVIRDLPQIGRQILLFFRRENTLALHTFPKRYSHRLAALDGPAQALDMILRWFPLAIYPQPESTLLLTVERFERLREKAESHQKDAALQMLAGVSIPEEEKCNLIEAIEHRTISGSFAALRCAQNTIAQAHSVAVVAGPTTAWLILQPEGTSQEEKLLIRRIGPGFESVVAGLLQKI